MPASGGEFRAVVAALMPSAGIRTGCEPHKKVTTLATRPQPSHSAAKLSGSVQVSFS